MPRLKEFKWNSWGKWALHEIVLDKPEIVAVDTETTGLEFYDEPFSVQLTWRNRHGTTTSAYFELGGGVVDFERRGNLIRVGSILRGVPAWVLHNAKFDLQKLLLIGAIREQDIEAVELHDTQTMYTLLDENGKKGLKDLAVRVLKYDDTISVPYKSGKKKGQLREVSKEKYRLDEARRELKLRKEDGFHLLPREVVIPYALKDTEFTLGLYEKLWPKLQKKDEALLDLYDESMQRKLTLLRMEADGFGLDVPYLEQTTSEYGVKVMEAWQRVTDLTGNPELNPNAPNQLLDAFEQRGLSLLSTEVDVLKKVDDDLARAVLEYRDVKKIHGTYLTGILSAQREGLVHPNFNDDGAATGRMSSGKAKE